MLSLTLWVSRAGWAVHIPTIFLSQWLNIKRWQTPGSPHLPPPLPSPLLPSLVSFLPTVSTVVTGASHSHSASFLTTSGPFPRAPIWSPWRLKGCSKASSCCVKVKVFHQRILPLCPFPSLVSELLLAVCTKDAYSFIFFFSHFPPHVPPVPFKGTYFWGQRIKALQLWFWVSTARRDLILSLCLHQ